MQKLVRAAREGTKDGLEKTKAAVKRGRSFIRTKSFISAGAFPRWVPSRRARGGGTLSLRQEVGAFSQVVDFTTPPNGSSWQLGDGGPSLLLPEPLDSQHGRSS